MEGGESMDIRITEIRISLRDDEKLKAFVTITLEGCFVVRGMKIIKGNQGMFVAMPSRRKPDGTYQDICHPINQATRERIEHQILEKYRQELEGLRRLRSVGAVVLSSGEHLELRTVLALRDAEPDVGWARGKN